MVSPEITEDAGAYPATPLGQAYAYNIL